MVIEKLVSLALFFLFIGLVAWHIRSMLRRYGGWAAFNPVQPGWSELRRQYESACSGLPLEMVEGHIGSMRTFQLGFDTNALIIGKPFSSTNLVRIPYAAIELLQPPEKFQITRFSEPEYSPGRFRAGSVGIFLPAYWAQELHQRMLNASPLP